MVARSNGGVEGALLERKALREQPVLRSHTGAVCRLTNGNELLGWQELPLSDILRPDGLHASRLFSARLASR